MSDSDKSGAAREEAEEASAFSHPVVPPDVSAAYGDHPDQVVDFYAPRNGATAAPLVVVLHGGAWRAPYDRQYMTPFCDFLARRGFAVANVEYRRGSVVPHQGAEGPVAGRWPETFDDVATALDAMPALAAEHLPSADPRRTIVTGHSAGGQLALWAGARHVLPEGAPWRTPNSAALRGVVAIAPLAGFVLAGELGVCDDACVQLLGGMRELFDERLPYVDPVELLPTGVATTVVQGRTDTTIPFELTEAYADAAAKAGEVVGVTFLEGVGHFPVIDPAADACAVVAEEIAQLAW
ncbi:alpha/beta hydrolase [Streptomyces sp. NPDC002795]|uniref:alpha/beta hydrolase n=1 Tax=Streptomyces sp. NPDC002795 TaxID=3364665 RepID=UPI0036B285BE